MPFINLKTNLPLPAEREQALKEGFGRAISTLPGKSEQWLMVGFEPECRLWFQGSAEPAALVEVTVYGGAAPDKYDALTGKLTALLAEELGLAPGRVYVKYAETPNWGWNGSNF